VTEPVCSVRLSRVLRYFLGPAFGHPAAYTAAIEGHGEEAWLKIYEIGAATRAAQAEPAPEQPSEPKEPALKGGRLSARAAMLCNEGGFQVFIGATSREEAAELIRKHCGVSSRAHLDHDERAAARLRTLAGDYDVWLRGET